MRRREEMKGKMEKTHLIIIVSLLITIFIVIFAVLLILAGNIQGILAPYIDFAAYTVHMGGSLQDGIMLTMLYTSLIPSALGAPLSWGASMLGLFNSNFGMNAFMGYYMLYEILAAL